MTSSSDSREYPDRPVVGVGVVVWREDRFLLVRRGKAPNKGQWSLPGGAQHLGETVFDAAHREIMEEAALDVEIVGLVDVVDGIKTDNQGRVQFHYTLVDLVAESKHGEAVAGDDAAAVGWYRLADLADLGLWSETERIIRESVHKRGSI
jgi:ADP-ribose pyrophosphatase YjhB (NUDIX family)